MYYTLEINDPDKLFFCSDSHFGHFNICKYCHRPFQTRAEMDQTLVDNWNSVVPPDGIVIHCGDFMLPHNNDPNEYMKYLKKLNGTVYLTRGNHDRIDIGTHLLDGVPKLIVNDIMMVEVEGIKIYAQHCGPCASHLGTFHVYGHIHTLFDGTSFGVNQEALKAMRMSSYDVGVDQNGYKPISYWELCDIFRKRSKER